MNNIYNRRPDELCSLDGADLDGVKVWQVGKGLSPRMDENVVSPPLLSVHIMLPEGVDRRLARRAERLPGASWPAWGGHITLVPNFVSRGTVEEARAAIDAVCAHEEPFTVRFAAPVAVQDTTRPDYYAVFLTVESVERVSAKNELNEDGQVDGQSEAQADEQSQRLHRLRMRLLAALEPLREDVRPQLVEGPFLPHVTLALGLGELEARAIVREMRADPISAEFSVEAVWMVTQTTGEGARFDRQPIPLGRVTAAELMRE